MRRSPLTRLANRRNFFSITKFSFYALNVNCYSSNRECVCFLSFFVRREYSTVFIFVLRTFVCLFLAFYPFSRGNILWRFSRVFLGCFCAPFILQPFFLFFWWWFSPKWVLRVCLSDTSAHTQKNCKIDLGVYLSLIQVGLFLYPSKNEVWLLDVCLSWYK